MTAEHGPDCECEDEDCVLRRKVLEKANGLLEESGVRRKVTKELVADTSTKLKKLAREDRK